MTTAAGETPAATVAIGGWNACEANGRGELAGARPLKLSAIDYRLSAIVTVSGAAWDEPSVLG